MIKIKSANLYYSGVKEPHKVRKVPLYTIYNTVEREIYYPYWSKKAVYQRKNVAQKYLDDAIKSAKTPHSTEPFIVAEYKERFDYLKNCKVVKINERALVG